MIRFVALLLALVTLPAFAKAEEAARDNRLFELRSYRAASGKLDALLTRFRDHTCRLFEQHGITNVGYWVPVENEQNILVFLLAYPDAAARLISWQGFVNDPEWQKVKQDSEVDGRLVEQVDQLFLATTRYSPSPDPFGGHGADRLFEMRTYTARVHHLPALHNRFRDHTIALFSSHGMTNLGYFQLLPGQPLGDQTLLYFLAHDNSESAAKSWVSFVADPAWVAAKAVSEAAAGGSLTVAEGIGTVFLLPTDFSPTR